MPALANVALTDTFDVWRTRTNQIIIKLDQVETSDAASFAKANAANISAGAAFDRANIAVANINYVNSAMQISFASANSGANTAIAAFGKANAANYYAYLIDANTTASFTKANTGTTIAGLAYDKANAANLLALTGGTGAATAFDKANAANVLAQSGLTAAGSAYDKANSANIVGVAAFNKANSTVIPINSDVVNVTRYIPFINATSGNAYTLNVSTVGLTFNPSTNTVASNNAYFYTSLGVGTAPSTTTGEIRATNDITSYYSSDASLKTNISPIPNALDKVMNIRGVGFDWVDSYLKERGGEDGYFVRKTDVGVIAQEIEKVLPEVVATRDNGIKAVRYEKLVALLIEAVKELNDKIEKK